jgi:hypothetical protein
VTKVAATTLIDTGASASFISAKFAKRLGAHFHRTHARRVRLADGTNMDIQGRTTPLPCELERFPFHQCFHVLPNLDGMDQVLGMDFLGKHDVTVQATKSQISIAAEPNPIVLQANPNSPTDPEDTGADIELLSAAQFARYCKGQGPEDQTFLGYTIELVAATEPMLVARTDPQPPEYKQQRMSLNALRRFASCRLFRTVSQSVQGHSS